MKKDKNLQLIPIMDRLINELYNNGLNVYKIAKLLKITPESVREYLPEKSPNYPSNSTDENNPLIQKILYDFDMPVATETLIENEKERYLEYSRLEKTSLRIMNSLLEYFEPLATTGDIKESMMLAKMASDFIKVTHSARQELIQKYAIDKDAENKNSNSIKVEFI